VEETVKVVLECVQEVLGIDVRSSFQTKKAREGRFQAERAGRMQNVAGSTSTPDVCTQQLDNLLIQYEVQEPSDRKREPSENSGAEDIISVISIQLLTRKDGN
jgi:hypothetical protein